MSKDAKEDDFESSTERLAEASADLTVEQQIDLMIQTMDEFCVKLEENGVHHAVLDAALITVFASRFAERGDREGYEAQLESALEEPWDEITLH